jgi:major vault protein
VASVSFDFFHKNSESKIRETFFGLDENKNGRKQFLFTQNNLVITNIDIQSVEPVDQRTRDSLQKISSTRNRNNYYFTRSCY